MKILNALLFAAAGALALPAMAQPTNAPMTTTPSGKVPAKPAKPPAVAAAKAPPATPSCLMDSRYVEDKTTWCVQKVLQQCNASTGNWISTGKRCG